MRPLLLSKAVALYWLTQYIVIRTIMQYCMQKMEWYCRLAHNTVHTQ